MTKARVLHSHFVADGLAHREHLPQQRDLATQLHLELVLFGDELGPPLLAHLVVRRLVGRRYVHLVICQTNRTVCRTGLPLIVSVDLPCIFFSTKLVSTTLTCVCGFGPRLPFLDADCVILELFQLGVRFLFQLCQAITASKPKSKSLLCKHTSNHLPYNFDRSLEMEHKDEVGTATFFVNIRKQNCKHVLTWDLALRGSFKTLPIGVQNHMQSSKISRKNNNNHPLWQIWKAAKH